MRLNQRTIKKEVIVYGIGVNTGEPCTVKMTPSSQNTGIRFIKSKEILSADLSNLGDSNSNTSLTHGDFKLETVEHLLSCLYGLFIDNVLIEVTGKEIPIGDGSAKIFYDAISRVGIKEIPNSLRTVLKITKRITVREGTNRRITITPAKKSTIDYSIDWHPIIKGKYIYIHGGSNYEDIAFAKTFAERSHIARIKKENRAKGLEIGKNCIDIDSKDAVKSKKYVKHKVLDLLGDFSLLYGLHFEGKITAVNAGHNLHHKLLKRLLDA
jgi:UDP-3-O-[3-hydroxymyristoyl] N-acetylglucosamine deacetylase